MRLAASSGPCEFTRRELGQAALGALLSVNTGREVWSKSSGAPGFDEITRWRGEFPALDQTVNGHPLAYLDSAATTQRPRAVLAALIDYYQHDNANPGATLHTLARRAYDVPVLSFVMAGYSPAEILQHLDTRGIAIRAGDLAALPLLKRFGVTAAARASCYLYTQKAELARLAAALRELTYSEGKDST